MTGREIRESGSLPAEMFRAHRIGRAPRGAAQGAEDHRTEALWTSEPDQATQGSLGVASCGVKKKARHWCSWVGRDVESLTQRGSAVPALKDKLINEDMREAVDK